MIKGDFLLKRMRGLALPSNAETGSLRLRLMGYLWAILLPWGVVLQGTHLGTAKVPEAGSIRTATR